MDKGLDPIYNEQTEILILGSAPSIKSLELQQYYGNKGNHFWKIMFSSLNTVDPIDYHKRIQILKQNKIGLWDVYSHFNRKGSLDSNFTEFKLNNFDELLSTAPIKLIIANGSKSYEQIILSNILQNYKVIKCLSTSGANNRKMIERKKEWETTIQSFL